MKPVVMLVDDDPGILSALKRMLRRDGYEILTMENARLALAQLETREVDLVVSDYKMPGLSGAEFLAQVATKWPATPRILLSGFASEIPADALASARVAAVLGKPWDDEELRSTIQETLGASRS